MRPYLRLVTGKCTDCGEPDRVWPWGRELLCRSDWRARLKLREPKPEPADEAPAALPAA